MKSIARKQLKWKTKVKYTLFYFLLAGFFVLALRQLEDYDIWCHLKTGQWIIDNLRIPHNQLFSYSIGDAVWIDHSWLFQIIVFLVYKFLGGISGLVLFKAVIFVSILWIVLKDFLDKVYFPVFLLSAWLCSSLLVERFPLRPEIISILFLCLFLSILFNKKDLWFLIVIQLLWVNIHGYAILGPVLLALFVLLPKEAEWHGRKILFIMILLFLFSPYGIHNIRYPFFAIKNFFQTAHNFYNISELFPIPLSDILFTKQYVLITAAVSLFLVSLLFNVRKLDIFNILIFVVFLSIVCIANRHIGFFAVVSSVCTLDNFRNSNLGYLEGRLSFYHRRFWTGVITILVVLFIGWHQFFKIRELSKIYVYSEDGSYKRNMFGIDMNRFPVKAVDFLMENNIKGPIFNDFSTGAYLIWRLYPSYKVFIDGRTEVYGKKYMDQFARALNDFEVWKRLDERYGFNAVVLDYSTTDLYYYLIRNLYKERQWRLVYLGDVALIFVKDNALNQDIISTKNAEGSPSQSGEVSPLAERPKGGYPAYFLNKARFFIEGMGNPILALDDLEKARQINPECYEVYQLAGYTYFKMLDFERAEDAFMKSLQLAPAMAEPYVNLGSVAAEKGLFKKAYSLYKQALSLDKNNKAAKDNLRKILQDDI